MGNIPEHIIHLRLRQTSAAIAVDVLREAISGHRLPCIKCICSAINLLWDGDFDELARRLRDECPELTRACVDFLMLPRSTEQRHRLSTEAVSESSGCVCDLSNPRVRALHPQELQHFNHPGDSPLAILSTTMFIAMSCVFSSMISDGNLRTFKRARMRVKYHKRAVWPAAIEDVLPYGMQRSMQSMVAWQGYCSDDIIMSAVRGLFFSVVYPAFPSVVLCDILPSVTYQLLDPALQRATSDRTNTAAQSAFLSLVAEIRLLFDYVADLRQDEISFIVGQHSAHAEVGHLITLLGACGTEISKILSKEERRRGLPPGGCTDTHARQYQDYHALAGCTTHLWTALGRLPNSHELRLTIWSKTYSSNNPSTIDNLAALATLIWNGHICANMSCCHTPISEGHVLPVCTGCGCTRYCSRRCQRSAWSDKRAPHREICAQLAELTRSVRPEFAHALDAVKDISSFREQCESAGLENEMLKRIVNHCRIVYRR